MSEMVERVARAMFEAMSGETHIGSPWDSRIAETQERYRAMARAAIEAMREPTPVMIDAGVRAGVIRDEDPDNPGIDYYPTRIWRGMIDEALKD